MAKTEDALADLVIRPVVAADVPAVIDHVAAVLEEFGLRFGQGSSSDGTLADLPASYQADGGQFWVALEGGALIGTCAIARLDRDTFEVRKMYLRSVARGRGLGRRLLELAIAHGRAAGARALVLDTTERMTGAQALYEASGFVRDDAQIRGARCTRGYRLDLVRGS